MENILCVVTANIAGDRVWRVLLVNGACERVLPRKPMLMEAHGTYPTLASVVNHLGIIWNHSRPFSAIGGNMKVEIRLVVSLGK
jgi:hypothetical protein